MALVGASSPLKRLRVNGKIRYHIAFALFLTFSWHALKICVGFTDIKNLL